MGVFFLINVIFVRYVTVKIFDSWDWRVGLDKLVRYYFFLVKGGYWCEDYGEESCNSGFYFLSFNLSFFFL